MTADLRREIANMYARNHKNKWQSIDDARPKWLKRMFWREADMVCQLLLPILDRARADALEEAAAHLARPEPPYFGAQNPQIIRWLRQRAKDLNAH